MAKIRTVELSGEEKQALEEGQRSGKSHAFRKRCQLVLLKSQGRTSKDVGQIVGMNHISVNNWLSRYQRGGSWALLLNQAVDVSQS